LHPPDSNTKTSKGEFPKKVHCVKSVDIKLALFTACFEKTNKKYTIEINEDNVNKN